MKFSFVAGYKAELFLKNDRTSYLIFETVFFGGFKEVSSLS